MNDFWDSIKYFTPDEFDDPSYPGSGQFIDKELISKLDLLRVTVNCPIVIHASVGGAVDYYGKYGHSPKSYHLKDKGCKASDIHLVTDMPPRGQYRHIELIGFSGIGIYYDWHWDGELLPIGFHVDLRPWSSVQRWTRRDGKYLYLLGRNK